MTGRRPSLSRCGHAPINRLAAHLPALHVVEAILAGMPPKGYMVAEELIGLRVKRLHGTPYAIDEIE